MKLVRIGLTVSVFFSYDEIVVFLIRYSVSV